MATDELAELLPPVPPPRELPHQAAHRAGLLAVLAADQQRSRPAVRRIWRGTRPPRRWLVPAGAAVAVLAIAIAVALPRLAGSSAAPPLALRGCGAPSIVLQPGESGTFKCAWLFTFVPGRPGTHGWQVPIAGVRSVLVTTPSGSVTVSAASARTAAAPVTARYSWRPHKRPPGISGKIVNGVLMIWAVCAADSPHCSASLAIALPAGLPVHASTDLGNVQVTGMSSSVDVSDSLGTVGLLDLSGPVNVTDALGDIDGSGLTGTSAILTADLGDIDVSFSAAPAQVRASSQDGDVTVNLPGTTSYRVSVSAQLGTATVRVPRAATSAHAIHADSQLGSVTIGTDGSG